MPVDLTYSPAVMPTAGKVTVGGATIFVLNVEKHERV